MKKIILVIAVFFTVAPAVMAREGDDSLAINEAAFVKFKDSVNEAAFVKFKDSVNEAMQYKSGIIPLPSAVVQLNVPKGFKYLGLEQSKYVIEDLWGNLPQEDLQGMLFPENAGPLDDSSYAYIITYSPVGYIKDGDAKDINYDDLMRDFKQGDVEENKKRLQGGATPMYTQGWAAKPFYDDQKKVLHWALEYKVEGAGEHTLNYKIISLGRKGMLTMNAIAGMSQMNAVKADVDKVLNMAEYTTGNQYKDYDSNVDEVAAWTVGGLVAGKVLLKTVAGKGILAFLKYIILGVVAAGGAIWRWVTGRKKKEEEYVYQPASAAEPDNEIKP